MPIDVIEQKFKEQVIDPSFRVPVLIDFWADWCGPCKMLSPVLEKLEREYEGNFILAKVDTERNQQLAVMFRISSIPDVRLIKEGKIHDQFVGALPEKDIRAFLNKHVEMPNSAGGEIATLARTNPMEALKQLKATKDVENRSSLIWTIFKNHLAKTKNISELKEVLTEIEEEDRSFSNQRRILLEFLENEKEKGLEDLKKLADPKSKISILEKYFSIVENAKSSERGKIKDSLLACFYLLEPEDEEVFQFRRKLSSILF